MKPKARIVNATLRGMLSGPFLSGSIYGHHDSLITDGTYTQTSRILKIDFENRIVETRNTIYDVKWITDNVPDEWAGRKTLGEELDDISR